MPHKKTRPITSLLGAISDPVARTRLFGGFGARSEFGRGELRRQLVWCYSKDRLSWIIIFVYCVMEGHGVLQEQNKDRIA